VFIKDLPFNPRVLGENEIENLRRVNYAEKMCAKYLMARGLEVSRVTCQFRASLVHPIVGGNEKEYGCVPDFAVRNPRRTDAHWAFIEVTGTSSKRLPTYTGEDKLSPCPDKAKQLAVMERFPEVRYVQIGREGLQKWANKMGLR